MPRVFRQAIGQTATADIDDHDHRTTTAKPGDLFMRPSAALQATIRK